MDNDFLAVYVDIYDRGEVTFSEHDLAMNVNRMFSLDDDSDLTEVADICSIWQYLFDRAKPLH
jgi:hypothetical protein